MFVPSQQSLESRLPALRAASCSHNKECSQQSMLSPNTFLRSANLKYIIQVLQQRKRENNYKIGNWQI